MGKTTLRYKLKKAFPELGAEMKKDSCGLYIVKYSSMEYFLDMDEKEGAFASYKPSLDFEGNCHKANLT